jgi:hypothetical protein
MADNRPSKIPFMLMQKKPIHYISRDYMSAITARQLQIITP